MDENENNDGNLWLALGVNILLTIIGGAAALLSGSLTLLSATADNFVDAISTVIGIGASRYGKKHPTERRTYGNGRATLLSALVNSSIALLLATLLCYEAYARIRHPEPVHGKTVLAVAAIGIILNGIVALRLYKERHDLNKKALMVDMAADSLASVGVLLSAVLILVTHNTVFDGVIAAAIAVLLIYNAWRVLKEVTHVLLDGVPASIDIEQVRKAITGLKGVRAIDDLHIWALSSTNAAMSCHIVFNSTNIHEIRKHTEAIKLLLNTRFAISHATIEAELMQDHNAKDNHA